MCVSIYHQNNLIDIVQNNDGDFTVMENVNV